MSADAVIAFYGLRFLLASAEVDAVEQRTDARLIAARSVKLHTYFGRLSDGEPHFLLVGTRLGVLGLENDSERSVDAHELAQIMRDTTEKLRIAGLPDEPKLHLQLESQY